MGIVTIIPRGWNASDIPNLTGKKFIVTGGTSGLGKECATELARAGANVTITARNLKKGEATAQEIGRDRVSVVQLDLTSLDSVRACAQTLAGEFDTLILNAGIMAVPMGTTADGFETQVGTNHLGHFALAGLLRNKITNRIVSVASQAHRIGTFSDGSAATIKSKCLGEGSYSPWIAYGTSKLANLLFTHELQRLSIRNNWGINALVAHPGYAATNLISGVGIPARMGAGANAIFAQSAQRGALAILCAATFPALVGASYIGPDGFMEMRGYPKLTRAAAIAYDQALAANLWVVSEELTGVSWS